MQWGADFSYAIGYTREADEEPEARPSHLVSFALDAGLTPEQIGEMGLLTAEEPMSAQRQAIQVFVDEVNRYRPDSLRIQDWEQDATDDRRPPDRRPGFKRVLESLRCNSGHVLIVPSLDVVTRSFTDLAGLWEGHFTAPNALVAIEEDIDTRDNFSGRSIQRVLETLARWRNDDCVKKSKAAVARLRDNGIPTGGDVRIGHKLSWDGRREVENYDEQKAVREVLRLAAAGLSVRGIAVELDRSGHPPRGKRWHPTTVARILERHRTQVG